MLSNTNRLRQTLKEENVRNNRNDIIISDTCEIKTMFILSSIKNINYFFQ